MMAAPLLKLWIVFSIGWLAGAVNAIEVVKEIAAGKRLTAGCIAGLLIVAMATTAAVGVGVGLSGAITWLVRL